MLDIGWSEMALIALVALIVIGPKELPKAMRSATKWIRKARSLAREFQSGVDDMVREADLEDARKAIQEPGGFDVKKTLEQTIDPTGDVRGEVEDLEQTTRADDASSSSAASVEAIDEKALVIEPPHKATPTRAATPTLEADADSDASKTA